MTDFITAAIRDRALGLALHYPLLYAAVLGLDAKRTFEFGAGGSTRVLLEALAATGGEHQSVSTDPWQAIADRHGIASTERWHHVAGLSQEHRDLDVGPLDLALHDGSHAADVVAEDVAWIWPRLRPFGLLFVHDTQHSYVGAQVRQGLRQGLQRAGAHYSATTLSYGFGLTIVRLEGGDGSAVVPAVAKRHGKHNTELVEVFP